MSAGRSRLRTLLNRFGTILEGIFVFVMLLGGIGIVFLGKVTGTISAGIFLISLGLAFQIFALVIVGIYFYIRFFRRRGTTE